MGKLDNYLIYNAHTFITKEETGPSKVLKVTIWDKEVHNVCCNARLETLNTAKTDNNKSLSP